jgi:hypothetical protein
MIIPNFDIDKFVDDDGRLTPQANLFFSELVTLFQQNLSDEGYQLPKQNAGTILQLNTALSTSGIIYNTSTNKAMVCENGTYKTITTS